MTGNKSYCFSISVECVNKQLFANKSATNVSIRQCCVCILFTAAPKWQRKSVIAGLSKPSSWGRFC